MKETRERERKKNRERGVDRLIPHTSINLWLAGVMVTPNRLFNCPWRQL